MIGPSITLVPVDESSTMEGDEEVDEEAPLVRGADPTSI
jgi:hypothetical protein